MFFNVCQLIFRFEKKWFFEIMKLKEIAMCRKRGQVYVLSLLFGEFIAIEWST